MKVHRFDNTSLFYQTVIPYLLKDEAENVLPIGICETLLNNSKLYDSQPLLVSVSMDDEIIAVAIRTPPHNLVLSKIKNLKALELIAQDLYSRASYSQKPNLPGVSGLTTESLEFAKLWSHFTG
ncbi:MAG: GNAT family N-acetyltransferase, partial [Cyanobacteria bacterium P01_A01_bin.45]